MTIIDGFAIDESKGFDVMRGTRVLKHFDSYEAACAYAAEKFGRYVRYFRLKAEKA